jgi:two-component system, sensor histidine kinase and response regulator
MLTSGPLKPETEWRRLNGVTARLSKPVPQRALLSAILDVFRGAPAAPASTESLTEGRMRPGPGLKILLAEDNQINQRVGTALLQKLGHSIDVVENGLEAVDRVRNYVYDAVFMDVQMPEMDGWAATAAIREWERSSGRRIPIIAMTAHATAGYREKCLEAGMDGYVSKPVSLGSIAGQIAALSLRPSLSFQPS